MTLIALFVTGWLIGCGFASAFIAAATRKPTPEPFVELDRLADLARCA